MSETPSTPGTVSPGKVGPAGWSGEGNPMTSPGVVTPQRGPGRPAKTTTVMGEPVSPPYEKPAPVAPSRRKLRARPDADHQMVFAPKPPEGLKQPEPPKNINETRVRRLVQEHPGEWGRLRVYVNKGTAREFARQIALANDNPVFDRLDNRYGGMWDGIVETQVVQTSLGWELWAHFTPSDNSTLL